MREGKKEKNNYTFTTKKYYVNLSLFSISESGKINFILEDKYCSFHKECIDAIIKVLSTNAEAFIRGDVNVLSFDFSSSYPISGKDFGEEDYFGAISYPALLDINGRRKLSYSYKIESGEDNDKN